jgi:hypothetical protein
MGSMVLDLDSRSTYANEYENILYSKNVWPILENDFNNKSSSLFQELFNDPADIRDPFIKDLYYKCDEIFRINYSHVIAYHACRILHLDEYIKYGLLASSQVRLKAKAQEIFAGICGFDKAFAEADSYFRLYDDSVSMYISAEFAPIEYLNKGSHYLRMVAANLGLEAEKRLSYENNRRKPFFVKCKIPVSWLEDAAITKQYSFLYRYNASLMRRLIWKRASKHEQYNEAPETLVIFKDIPPKNIESILSPEICVNWK